ncbi:MAG TPA: HAD-IC family P-type ATPase [Actinomycetota bacterium]|nr:HAD-IC family P-type ATPase [Actinomycetota bacterium]
MDTAQRSAVDPAHGLSAADVAERGEHGDVNRVPAAPTRTVGQIVRANVFTRFNALLGAMLVLILIVGPLQDALFGLVLVANTLIGIVQELRAKRTLDRLTLLTAPTATVVRDGEPARVPPSAIVRDDVLALAPGDQVVVDGEVLVSDRLEVDESLLTGESEPVVKAEGDRVLSGSFVVAGSGRAQVEALGTDAYAARIAADARRFTLTRSELRSGTDRILKYVTWAIVPTAALLFVSQYRAQNAWRPALSGAVAGTVAMVPEGLVLLTSIAFSVAVVRLARRRVLVQELPAVEGLARVDVLCIDKTGTLTEGKLTLDRVERLDDGLDPEPVLAALAAADPAPNATLRAIDEGLPPVEGWTVEDTVPFSSARKWSAAAFADHGAWILGAPDVVTDDPDTLAKVARHAETGARVVLLARADELPGDVLAGVRMPVALVVLADRVRPDAADTLRYFAEQGVRVTVISGDAPSTVGAIASSLGLDGANDAVDARRLSDEPGVLADALEKHRVFGRVTPHQKRAMVTALQTAGHTVAMTGDGVNDALALKDADIGVAMGTGADATRAVAQIVLLDGTFDALPSVVGEGRRVLGNIERTSNLYLTKTVYAMVLSLAVGVASVAFPFLPRHLTLIGAITIGIPSFFLALAPSGQRFRPGFVGRVLRFTIPTGILAATATFLGYRLATHEPGVTTMQARTTAVMTLTFVGLLVLSIVAAPLNRWRLALVWAMGVLAVLAFVLPATQTFFALDPPPLTVWLASIGIAALTWTLARFFVPEERPVGTRWRAEGE